MNQIFAKTSKMNEPIVDPVSVFRDLGALHDSQIDRVTWDAATRSITLSVDDLNASFDGLPEYSGKQQASIVFTEVENLSLNCDSLKEDIQCIYRLETKKKDDLKGYELMLRIAPSGQLNFDFETVKIIYFE